MNNNATCHICTSSEGLNFYHLYDDRYGYPGIFQLKKCTNCGHIYLLQHHSEADLKRLYTNYYPRKHYSINDSVGLTYNKCFSSWLNGERRSAYTYIPPNVRVLDIGCGFGQSLGYHKSRGCEVYGVEADENIKRVAEHFGYDVKAGVFDANDYKPEYFDYVTMDQVIEHMVNPIETLIGIERILKPGGYVILSTPNPYSWGAKLFGKKWINWHTPYHLHFFSRKSLNAAMNKAGLEIDSIKTITSSEWLFYQWCHLIFYPKAGVKSIFWESTNQHKRFTQKIIFRLLRTMHRLKINHFLTRIFDSTGIGDNYIIIGKKPL